MNGAKGYSEHMISRAQTGLERLDRKCSAPVMKSVLCPPSPPPLTFISAQAGDNCVNKHFRGCAECGATNTIR